MTAPAATGGARRRHIVFFGNPLHGDDGFGPAVYERLAARRWPDDVSLSDAGTAGPTALALFEGFDEIVVVDASSPAGRPGRIWRPSRDEVFAEAVSTGHGVGVGHLIRCVEATFVPVPAISFVAVEAASATSFRMGLSEPVARAVETVADLLLREHGEVAHG